MSNKIKHKQSGVAGKIPALTDLDVGELLFNYADGVLYCKKAYQGIETIVEMHSSETPHLFKDVSTPSAPSNGYLKLFAKGGQFFYIDPSGIVTEFLTGSHNHDKTYLRLDGGSMTTTDLITNLNANYFQGYKPEDFAFADHTHPSTGSGATKIELSNSPAPITANTWTAIPGLSLGITEPGNYLISAQIGLQRSSTAGYVAARIKVGTTIIASAEEYGSNRAAFYLSSIKQVILSANITVEIWSSVSGTSAIAATPSSLSTSATILTFFKFV